MIGFEEFEKLLAEDSIASLRRVETINRLDEVSQRATSRSVLYREKNNVHIIDLMSDMKSIKRRKEASLTIP